MLLDHKHVEVLSAVVFTFAFAIHFARTFMGWTMQLGPYRVPMYVSWAAVVLAGYLSYRFWSRILRDRLG